MDSKIKNIPEIEEIVRNLKEQGKTIVTTNGSFDILHLAHVNLLKKAKNEGDILIVLVNSDESIKRNKGKDRPIISQDERAEIIAALESVDYVVIFEEDKPLTLLEKIKPHKHIKGGSWDPIRMKEEKEFISTWKGEYKNFELEEGFSTTDIIERILEKHK
ncbi:MAG: adenylyltransferase/cytidyltransferase family protein [Nanoarchaeota archaeon]|nr:adenylyltransferase/cytidyltransferase family protein [Nanoarchaeota archaeon]